MHMTDCCPTCKRPLPPPLRVTGTVRQAIVDYVAGAVDGLSMGQLIELVYACRPNGEPEWAANSIKGMVSHANKQLARQGWRLSSTRGPGARYRLVPFNDLHAATWSKPFAHPELL
jgi:hypothetical protein